MLRSTAARFRVRETDRAEEVVGMRSTSVGTVLLVACALSVGAWGCGSPAKAEPLDVTYYYLPG